MSEKLDRRIGRVKAVLITQDPPVDKNSTYHKLAEKCNLKIDFKNFLQVARIPMKDFRKQRIDISQYTAIIFTSRHSIDHFFSIIRELKIDVSQDMKYFCISEQTANYLQKYTSTRKRKVFIGNKTTESLLAGIKKNHTEKYLFPCSDMRKNDIPHFMKKNKIQFTESVLYHTIPADLSEFCIKDYDILAFFSPTGISSLLTNFPDFVQNGVRLATFGASTAKAVRDAGLILDIEATPTSETPSMTGAIEEYIKRTHIPAPGKILAKKKPTANKK